MPRRQQRPRTTWPLTGTAKKPRLYVSVKEIPRKAKKLAATMAKKAIKSLENMRADRPKKAKIQLRVKL